MGKKKEENKEEKVVELKDDKPVKLTYDQLENIAGNLSQENKLLRERLQEAVQYINGINEVGMLLSILGKAEYFDSGFIDSCSKRIQETIEASWKSPEAAEA